MASVGGGAAQGAGSAGEIDVVAAVSLAGKTASLVGTSVPALSASGTCQVWPQYHSNCASGKIVKCPDCNYTYCSKYHYCDYHAKPGSWYSVGGHTCP
mmetsp:Transcript_35497/g.94526  ORF Transcript_35497/g.94526 Transcript_35497/m.94526 type:complete len:98 (-) Transcript_35497:547-840(-)